MRKYVYSTVKLIVLLCFGAFMLISGCAPAKVYNSDYKDGVKLTSISSNTELAYSGNSKSLSGSGLLMVQKPDKIRAAILSPFGSILQEVFISGDHITIIDPGNNFVITGLMQNLPEKGIMSCWRNIHWLTDVIPPDRSKQSDLFNNVDKSGRTETVQYENGVVISKSYTDGEKVTYKNYVAVNGAAVPLEINYTTKDGDHFKIVLDEPEINQSIGADSFMPKIDKSMRILPLEALRESGE